MTNAKTQTRIKNVGDHLFDKDGNFDWDSFESGEKSLTTFNPHIKLANEGDKVYSNETYAQSLYNLYLRSMSNIKTDIDSGSIYTGFVHAVTSEWASVDIGYRELVFIKLLKESKEFRDLTPGQYVSVLIEEKNTDDIVLGSISAGMRQQIFNQLKEVALDSNKNEKLEEKDQEDFYVGYIEQMIENGGYVVDVKGVKCFMPGSLAGMNKLHDFQQIVGKSLYVLPVSYSAEKGTVVVSHKDYLKSLIPTKIQELKQDIENEQTGFVTGTTKYGVFCEFKDCLTGMVHVNDLAEDWLQAFNASQISPGQAINFWVKEIVNNAKIILTQKEETLRNPWKDIEKRYQVPTNVEATVKSTKNYGIFVEIEKDVVGLLHVSELDENMLNLYNKGDKITVRVNRINSETKKVFLKLPK